MNYWKSFTSKLAKHVIKDSHGLGKYKYTGFKFITKAPPKKANNQMSQGKVEKIKKKRERLIVIIRFVLYLVNQGLSLRGHRDDSQHNKQSYINSENFQELLKLISETGNSYLKSVIENVPKNARCRSKTIQNQIISVVRDKFKSEIIGEIKKLKFLSIPADAASDVSNQELMSLVLKYLDSNFLVKESFVGFIHCNTSLTGEDLSNTILKEIESLGLSMDDCIGQEYDGAGAIEGSEKSVASHISQRYPSAIYIHCYSHIQNLCVMKCIKIEQVQSMFEYCHTISEFFNNFPKRFQLFEKKMFCKILDTRRHKNWLISVKLGGLKE